MKTEIWKEIKGYEGLYQVSNYGRVKSLLFRNNIVTKKREKILAQHISNSGYLMVGLRKSGKLKKCYVHRLVAACFVDNMDEKTEVNHIDGNKRNNTAYNLEFCTPSENIKHSYKNNLRKPLKNEHNKYSKAVSQYDINMNFIKTYPSIAEAKRQNDISTIIPCKNGKMYKCGGYIWKYAEATA